MVGSAYFTGNPLGTLLAGTLIAHCGFNRSYYLASAILCRWLRRLGAHPGILELAGMAIRRRDRLRHDPGGGGECAHVQRQRAPGRLLAAYDGLLRGHSARATAGQQGADGADGGAALGDRSGAGGHLAPAVHPHRQRPRRASGNDPGLVYAAPASGASGVSGCIISGIVLGSLYGLMPLYLNHQG